MTISRMISIASLGVALAAPALAIDKPAVPEVSGAGMANTVFGIQGGYADGGGFWGYSSTNGTTKPTLMQFGFGVTGAYWVMDWMFAGVASNFRIINHYSDTSTGNFRGTRWNLLAPTAGFKFGSILAKLELQFLGNYKLTNKASDGSTEVSYKSPMGARLIALYPLMDKVHAGVQFEFVSFGKQNTTTAGDTTLSSRFSVWRAGLEAAYVL